MDIFISIVVFAAVAFAFFKWALPFIKARNAQSDRTSIQGYGPQSKPVTHGPNTPSKPKPPIVNEPKPPFDEQNKY